ncbi:MAG: peptidyl-prolyl cis-trans isomerase [bacterium]
MKSRLVLLCFACLAALLASCTSTDDRVVAQVGDYEVTVGKIKAEYLAISEHARPPLASLDEKSAFAKDVVAKEVIRIEAERAGFGDMPEAIEAREAMLQNKAWQTFYEEQIKGKISITEEEMRALYDKQKIAYHLAWIFTRSRATAQAALDMIRSGKTLGEAAMVYSIDPSRSRDGDIGFRPLGTMPANVEEAIEALEPGEISDVIPYDGYYAVIRLIETREREQTDFESSRIGLESMLMTKKITDRQKELAAQYLEKYKATYNEDVIELVAARTREANRDIGGEPGRLPEFSEDELGLVLASHAGDQWTVGRYMERIATVRDFGRPSYGADAEVIKSVMRDYMTGEFWILEALDMGYGEREDVVAAADREYEMVMVTAFHDDLVKDVVVDDAAFQSFYDEYREQLKTEPIYNLAIIVVETRGEAEEIYEELLGGADFASLARTRSIDPNTAPSGGKIRETFTSTALQQFPDVHDVVYEMEEGEISKPLLLPPAWGPEGFMVIKLLMKEEPRPLTLDEVKTMLGPRVLALEQDKVFSMWLSEKMEELDVSVNPDVLSSIDFSTL